MERILRVREIVTKVENRSKIYRVQALCLTHYMILKVFNLIVTVTLQGQ